MLPGKRKKLLREAPVIVLKNTAPGAKPSLTCQACLATFKIAAGATAEARPSACPKCGGELEAIE